MDILFRRQPPGSNLCGQCCVAMLLNLTISEARVLIGKGGKTSTRHLRAALETKGLTLGPRLDAKKVRPEPGKVYLARVYWVKGTNRTHWVIVNAHGIVVDPAHGFDPDWTLNGVSYMASLYEVTRVELSLTDTAGAVDAAIPSRPEVKVSDPN